MDRYIARRQKKIKAWRAHMSTDDISNSSYGEYNSHLKTGVQTDR